MSSKRIYGAKTFIGSDDKYHYTYRITNIVENKHYYGVRSSKIDPYQDLGSKYISSSNTLKPIIKQFPENFKFKILKCFSDRKLAALHEIELHHKFDVKTHSKFYNIAASTVTNFSCAGSTWISNGKEYKISYPFEIVPEGWYKCAPAKGLVYITNGEINKTLKDRLPVPDGWRLGKASSPIKNKIMITNGKDTLSIHKHENIPDGWYVGSDIKGKLISIHNNVKTKRIKIGEPIPEGWVLGSCNKPISNTMIITNGVEYKHIDKGQTISEGWHKGSPNKGKITITNFDRTITKRIASSDPIPEGWLLGSATANRIRITNGHKSMFISKSEVIPEGWYKGVGDKGLSKNTIMITNGIDYKTIKHDEHIPDGWYKGSPNKNRINITDGKTNKKILKTQQIPDGWYLGSSMKGRIKITNGQNFRYIDSNENIPDGWYPFKRIL